MKRILLSVLLLFQFISTINAQNIALDWAKSTGGTNDDWGTSILTDNSGNIYTIGQFKDTADFDPGIGVYSLISNGSWDFFIQKLDSNGNFIWAKRIGGPSSDLGLSACLDPFGNIFVTGTFSSTININTPLGSNTLTSNGGNDIFILKTSPSGSTEWLKQIGSTGSDVGRSIFADNWGNVYTTGLFNGTVDFNPNNGNSSLSSNGQHDVFIQKLDSNGTFKWAKSFGNLGDDVGKSIVTDSYGNVYTLGTFEGHVDFNPNTGNNYLSTIGLKDTFIEKLDSNGNFVWVKQIGGQGNVIGNSISLDVLGNIFSTGYFYNTADFNPNSGVYNLTSTGNSYSDVFIQKLNSNGSFVWAKQIEGNDNDKGHSIKPDIHGNIYTTGSFKGTADFNPNQGINNLTSNGGTDIFIQKLDSNGNYIWAKNIGGQNWDQGYSITIDTNENIYVTGEFSGIVDFNPGVGIVNLSTDTSNFFPDAFTMKLSSCISSVFIDSVFACSSYTWINGNTYTSSNNTATHTLTNSAGCDSIVTLNLTINNSSNAIDTIVACNSYTWIDGNTYTTSNSIATHTLTNSVGCDSIITLNLTINNTSTSTENHFVCDSLVWIDGNTYTSSNNTATHTLTNTNGCDSIVTLNLTINKSFTTDTLTACDSLTWIDGNTYTSSNNTATHTLTNTSGCDSIVTLHLTVNHSSTGIDSQVSCNSYTWIDGNTYTSSNNTATHTLTNAVGCDSIVTLNLTINNSSNAINTIVACNSYTWVDGNTYTSSNSTATHTIVNTAGCDSIITLNLTINNSSTFTDHHIVCDSLVWIDGNTYTSSNNTATHTLTNTNGCDSIVTLNLTINKSFTTDTHVACNSYTWIDGNTYTNSNNTATHTLTNVASCDSTITLNLTINNSSTGIDTQTACSSYTWIDGNTYTNSNNTATHTLTNSTGCDSIVTLNLTISNNSTGIDTQVACNSYTWIDGNTYTNSNNTATHTLTNSAGCDSIVTLNLTINNSSTGIDTQIVCDSLTWIDGITYTSNNNTATHTLTNTSGCDSVVTLNLTINKSFTTDSQIACNSYTWIDGNTYTNSNNSATHTLTNSTGCDSIITLNLTINNSSTGVDIQTVCDSLTWIDGNTYTSSNNSATHTLINAEGCDSVVTLNLKIQTVTDTSVTLEGTTIATNNQNATGYQWLDCNNNFSPINGETNSSFTATTNGSYAIEFTENSCKDTSRCVLVNSVGLPKLSLLDQVQLYPNPNNGTFVLNIGALQPSQVTCKLYDINGRLIQNFKRLHSYSNELKIDVSPGVYVLRLQTVEGIKNIELIIR